MLGDGTEASRDADLGADAANFSAANFSAAKICAADLRWAGWAAGPVKFDRKWWNK